MLTQGANRLMTSASDSASTSSPGRITRPHEGAILPEPAQTAPPPGRTQGIAPRKQSGEDYPPTRGSNPPRTPPLGRRTVRELRLISPRRVESPEFQASGFRRHRSTSRRIPVRRPCAGSAAASCSRRAAVPPDDNLKRYRPTSSPGRITRPTSQRSSPNQRQALSPTGALTPGTAADPRGASSRGSGLLASGFPRHRSASRRTAALLGRVGAATASRRARLESRSEMRPPQGGVRSAGFA